jgi:acetoin utilization protein AcuB
MLVRDVMTATPMTVDPEAPVETAVAVMRERRLRHLPVVDGEGRLIGIVTDRDLRSAMFGSALVEHLPAEQGGRLRALTATLNDIRVSHVMTWKVVTIGPQAPVAQAAAIMANVRIGSLPVVEGTRVVGIVTEHDVLKALATTLPCIKGADPDMYLP